jgi:peroxiredoxin
MVLQSKYGNEKVQFIGIALDDVAAVKVFQEKTGVNYPLLIAGDWAGFALAKKLGNIMSAIPYTVVVNSAGMIIYRHMGELSASELNSVVEPLL